MEITHRTIQKIVEIDEKTKTTTIDSQSRHNGGRVEDPSIDTTIDKTIIDEDITIDIDKQTR